MDQLCADSVDSVNLVTSNPWIFLSVNLLICDWRHWGCLILRLARSIWPLFCQPPAFKRSLNLSLSHGLYLGSLVCDCQCWLTRGWVCGWGSFKMSSGYLYLPVYCKRLTLPLCVCARSCASTAAVFCLSHTKMQVRRLLKSHSVFNKYKTPYTV